MPIISLLLGVSFYTILERKILSYIQLRKGPNKVGIIGVLQPFRDAIKLFNKKLVTPDSSNPRFFYATPSLSLVLALLLLSITPFFYHPPFDIKHNVIIFIVISSLSVYSILWMGWASNSKYAHIGAIRRIAQIISYEVSFFLIILFISLLSNSYYFTQIRECQILIKFIWGNLFIFFLWFSRCLAEVNRRPFDFAEGESELVSGFNVEFMGGWFALIFLSEYLNIIILRILTTLLFFSLSSTLSLTTLILISVLLLWVRGRYPRFRYDILMHIRWKIFLPLTLFILPLPLLFNSLSF